MINARTSDLTTSTTSASTYDSVAAAQSGASQPSQSSHTTMNAACIVDDTGTYIYMISLLRWWMS